MSPEMQVQHARGLPKLTDHHLLWIRDLLFSLYFAGLIISVDQAPAGFDVVGRVRRLYVSYAYPGSVRGVDDFAGVRFTSFILVWLLCALILVCLRLLGRSPARRLLSIFVGTVAALGLPLAYLYTQTNRPLFLELELVIAAACILLYAHRNWPPPGLLTLALIVLHFGLWTGFWSELGLFVVWPGWDWLWLRYELARMIYPLLGLAVTLVWAAVVERSSLQSVAHH